MEHDIIQKCWAYFVSCVQINTPCSWDVFTPITPLGRHKSAQPFTSLLPLRQTIPFTTIPNPPTKWSAAECVNLNPINLWTPDFFHIFCTGDFLEMFVLVSGIPNIQTKISFTGEPWSKTLRDIPLYLSVNRDPHFMADEIIPYYNRVVSSPSPGPSTAYISFQHSSLFWSLRWCFVLFVVETKLLKRERSYSKDHQNSPNLQKRQSTTLPQASSKSSQIRCQKKERAGMRMRFESKPHGSQWFTSFNLMYVLVLFSGIFRCFCFMVSGIECW